MEGSRSKKLLLINPANQAKAGFVNDTSTSFMPICLGIVAALTPPNWEVELLDESFEQFNFKQADLVALTSFTSNAPRAYELASFYREKGIYTVMGGIHASMFTEEVSKFVDTVVTGEAEGAWTTFLADFESGVPKALYEGGITDIHAIPHVRREIFKYPYVYDLVQTSRGCPQGCDFCSVTQMCGRTYRERDIEDVLDEMEESPRPMMFIVDDNLVNNKKGADERAISLFKGMLERGIKKQWMCQSAINFADNEEVLYWARKSGCVIVMLGFEAETSQALKDVKKNLNLKKGVESYDVIFRRIHKHGIGMLAFMIFGMESDKREDLYARGRYITKSTLDCYQTTVLTPLPGTALFERMKQQNRIVWNNYPADWQRYHFIDPVLDLPNLNHTEIATIMEEVWFGLYNKVAIRKRMFRTLWNTKSFRTAYWSYATNHNYGRISLDPEVYKNPYRSLDKSRSTYLKRWLYLKFTDKVIWLIYQLIWTPMLKKLSTGSD
jgi:radical SAM superfamily enzyme YgiQ (UPF0313 family)